VARRRFDEEKFRVKAHSRAARGAPRQTHEIEVDADDKNHAARLAAKQIGSDRSIIIRKIQSSGQHGAYREPERKHTPLIQKGRLTDYARRHFSSKAVGQYDRGEEREAPKKTMALGRPEPKLTQRPRGRKRPARKSKGVIYKHSSGQYRLRAHKQYRIVRTAKGWRRQAKKLREDDHSSYLGWLKAAMAVNAKKKADGYRIVNRQAKAHSSFGYEQDGKPVFHAQWDRVNNKGFVREDMSDINELTGKGKLPALKQYYSDNARATKNTIGRHGEREYGANKTAADRARSLMRRGAAYRAFKLAKHDSEDDRYAARMYRDLTYKRNEETDIRESSFRSMIRTHVRAANISAKQFHAMSDPDLDPTEKRSALKRLHRQMRYARKKSDAYADRGYDNRFAEETQIDEISAKTLVRYIKRAGSQGAKAWDRADREEDRAMSTDGNKYPEKQARHQAAANKANALWSKRRKGANDATDKLVGKAKVKATDKPMTARKVAKLKADNFPRARFEEYVDEASRAYSGKINWRKAAEFGSHDEKGRKPIFSVFGNKNAKGKQPVYTHYDTMEKPKVTAVFNHRTKKGFVRRHVEEYVDEGESLGDFLSRSGREARAKRVADRAAKRRAGGDKVGKVMAYQKRLDGNMKKAGARPVKIKGYND
jgi:hypothetical protein